MNFSEYRSYKGRYLSLLNFQGARFLLFAVTLIALVVLNRLGGSKLHTDLKVVSNSSFNSAEPVQPQRNFLDYKSLSKNIKLKQNDNIINASSIQSDSLSGSFSSSNLKIQRIKKLFSLNTLQLERLEKLFQKQEEILRENLSVQDRASRLRELEKLSDIIGEEQAKTFYAETQRLSSLLAKESINNAIIEAARDAHLANDVIEKIQRILKDAEDGDLSVDDRRQFYVENISAYFDDDTRRLFYSALENGKVLSVDAPIRVEPANERVREEQFSYLATRLNLNELQRKKMSEIDAELYEQFKQNLEVFRQSGNSQESAYSKAFALSREEYSKRVSTILTESQFAQFLKLSNASSFSEIGLVD